MFTSERTQLQRANFIALLSTPEQRACASTLTTAELGRAIDMMFALATTRALASEFERVYGLGSDDAAKLAAVQATARGAKAN